MNGIYMIRSNSLLKLQDRHYSQSSRYQAHNTDSGRLLEHGLYGLELRCIGFIVTLLLCSISELKNAYIFKILFKFVCILNGLQGKKNRML